MKDIHKKVGRHVARVLKKNPETPMHRFLFDLFLLAVGMGILLIALALIWVNSLQLPSFNDFEARKVANSTRIYDRTGKILLYNFHANIRRTVVPFDQVSLPIKQAVIAVEDDTFYTHSGIRPAAILRSIFKTATGDTQGGSTITQQIVKNSLLTPEQTITRKLKEWILALKLEHNMTKDEILAIYLNESPFGGTIYGVEEASLAFFGKNAKDVTLVEAAYLAALPQAPSRYSPYGKHTDKLENRKNFVLRRMFEQGYITETQMREAQKTKVTFQQQAKSSGKALHFDFYIREYLENTYGEDMIENGGLKIISTLDWELQKKAEETVLEYALKNKAAYDAENAGLVAIDSRTGEILAMVGSRDYFDPAIDGKVNITLARRQPGSSFKPLVYAAAFEKGYTPETVLFDVPTEFNVNCPIAVSEQSPDSCYSPVNYDGQYRGPVNLRNSLAQSLNVPAVKLLYLTGVTDAITQARKMGITTLGTKSQYGLTLVLGGGEVTLLELTGAYTSFANEGVRPQIASIISIEDNTGKMLEKFTPRRDQVLSRETALRISSILSDNVARTPAFGAASPLFFGGRDVAVKTGTTNDYRDVWTVGYTPSITVGVWGGNNDNRPIAKKAAGAVISPMWRSFMDKYFELYPTVESFGPAPSSADNPNPILRGIWCSAGTGIHSILYFLDKNNPREYSPGRTSDPQWRMWEGAIQIHGSNYGCPFADGELTGDIQDTNVVDTTTNEPGTGTPSQPLSEISIPFSVYGVPGGPISPDELVSLSTNSSEQITKVEYSLGGNSLGGVESAPFAINFTPSQVGATSGNTTLRVKVYTVNGYSIRLITITIK
jgi:1A family penicillin-binding protein